MKEKTQQGSFFFLTVAGLPSLTVSQKVEKVCHFERQREIFLLNQLVLLRFLPLVEMTIGQFGLLARPSSLV